MDRGDFTGGFKRGVIGADTEEGEGGSVKSGQNGELLERW